MILIGLRIKQPPRLKSAEKKLLFYKKDSQKIYKEIACGRQN